MSLFSRYFMLSSSVAAVAIACTPAAAYAQASAEFNQPALPMADALRAIASKAGVSVAFKPSVVRGRTAPALRGNFSAQQAIERALDGSGLRVRVGPAGGYVIEKAPLTAVSVTEETASSLGDGSRVAGEADAGSAPAENDGAEIVVTGTNIRGVRPAGARVDTYSRSEIATSGKSTLQDYLQTLPVNFSGGATSENGGNGLLNGGDTAPNSFFGSGVNLRGLGAASTLVLVDGRRAALGGGFGGGFVDISAIPASAVERIEVLPDGASALYGSDAVGGVVNIVLRKGFSGAETLAEVGLSHGTVPQYRLGQSFGAQWQGGDFSVAYEYYHREPLNGSKRRYATSDLRSLGGGDYRSLAGNPGTIIVDGVTYAIPGGQNGTGLTGSDLVAGTQNLSDPTPAGDLLPEQTRHAIIASIRQQVSDSVAFFLDANFADRKFSSRAPRVGASNPFILVPATNPFYVNPTGGSDPVQVEYLLDQDLGPETTEGNVRTFGGAAGVSVELPFGWEADAYALYSRDNSRSITRNVANTFYLDEALADSDPNTAFNPFGEGSNTPPSTLDRIRGYIRNVGRYEVKSANLKLQGKVVDLPGGSVKAALGAEHRRESFSDAGSENFATGPDPVPTSLSFARTRKVSAVFGELFLPLVGARNQFAGVRALNISAAVRHERYSDFGSTTTPKVGFNWMPVKGLELRGSFSKAFRAPLFRDLVSTNNLYFSFPIPDPTAPAGTTNVLILRGTKPGIGPERARVWSLGFDIDPVTTGGWHAGGTYFNIRYKDRIADPSNDLFDVLNNEEAFAGVVTRNPDPSAVEVLYGSPYFFDIGIPASDVGAIADLRVQNLSVVKVEGIDGIAGYLRELSFGTVSADVSATYYLRYNQQLTATSPAQSIVNQVGRPASFRARASLGVTTDTIGAHLFANYIGRYRNQKITPAARVAPWTTVDASLSYRVQGSDDRPDLAFQLSVNNVFNRRPPFVENGNFFYAIGFDPANADPIGRTVQIRATARW